MQLSKCIVFGKSLLAFHDVWSLYNCNFSQFRDDFLLVSVDIGTYMRLDLLLGSARGCLGSTCISLCGWKWCDILRQRANKCPSIFLDNEGVGGSHIATAKREVTKTQPSKHAQPGYKLQMLPRAWRASATAELGTAGCGAGRTWPPGGWGGVPPVTNAAAGAVSPEERGMPGPPPRHRPRN